MNEFLIKSNSASVSEKASFLKSKSKIVSDNLNSKLEKSKKNNESFKPYQDTYYVLLNEILDFIRKFEYWENQKEDKRKELQFLEKKFNSFKNSVKVHEDILNTYRAKDKLNTFLTDEAHRLNEKTLEQKQNSLENNLYSLLKRAKESSEKHDSKNDCYRMSYKVEKLKKDINSFMEDVNDLEIG